MHLARRDIVPRGGDAGEPRFQQVGPVQRFRGRHPAGQFGAARRRLEGGEHAGGDVAGDERKYRTQPHPERHGQARPFLRDHQDLLTMGHHQMAGLAHLLRQGLHHRQRGLLQPARRRVAVGQLKQLQGEPVLGGQRVPRDIAAPFQHAQHAEDLGHRPPHALRQGLLRHAARLLGQRLQQVEPLFQRRRGIARARVVRVVHFSIDQARVIFHI
ncbi:MAG TPA: hypothetical protein VMU82_08955 [Acetobacteraceae bacterium]|nr:hypothetical protein [Acetobacteraceae bacterium]